MDPNANLQEQEWLLIEIERLERANLPSKGNRDKLKYLRSVLSGWMKGGGFEPDWSKAPKAAAHYGR